MKANITFSAFPFLLLRTPLLSMDNAYNFPADTSTLFQEGLYLSSPEFWEELKKKDYSIADDKIAQTLHKYWLRSSTRCTPYGTFAGSTLINITDRGTNITLDCKEQYFRYLRLDMNYMSKLIAEVSKIPAVLNQLKFFPNNSIYYISDYIRYAEYTIQNNTRHYYLASVEKTSYLIAVLEKAKEGLTIDELVAVIMMHEEVDENEANIYISSLWESQLLVSELEPCITGPEPLDKFIQQISLFQGVDNLRLCLFEIQTLLQHPRHGVEYYREVEGKLKNIGASLELPKNTLQVDLFLRTKNSNVNQQLVDNILAQVSDLMALSRKNENVDLNNFKSKFYNRYEDAEMPLNIVLDADIGIGYAGVNTDNTGKGTVIENLPIRVDIKKSGSQIDYIIQYTLLKYDDFIKSGKTCIEIKEVELQNFKSQVENLVFPTSMFLMGSLLSKGDKLDTENFLFDLAAFGGPSAGNLLGRFAHGDNQILEVTREILKKEELEHPGVLFAEIAHLPQARIGNILLRPILRKYEIPYVGKSGALEENLIPIDDLMVSVKSNEVIIRSRKFNRRVIPRLTTAHNFGFNSLPVYKFLCDLQGQGLSYPNVWDWGHLELLKHLPRVMYKNIIIKKARWKIEENDIKDLTSDSSSHVYYFRDFRSRLNIPQKVLYKENDNELLIDFEKTTGITLFVRYLRKNKVIQLEEFLFSEENCVVRDFNGNPFTNQVIIPVHQNRISENQKESLNEKIVNGSFNLSKRIFSVYSEWIYFKVYCGPKTAETLLKNTILPFIEEGIKTQKFEHFFFVRFKDDDTHLRIRFFNSNIENQLQLKKEFMLVLQGYIDNGLVHKIVIDSYVREIERYGEGLVGYTEKLFHSDSLAILRFINLLEDENESEKYRLLFALRGIDMLLIDFGFSPSGKLEMLRLIQSAFFKEFGGHSSLQKQLNDKYRKYQKDIFSHMDYHQDAKNEIEAAVEVFQIRSEMNKPIVKNILSQMPTDNKHILFELMQSYIHMFMNRLFISHQRNYELVVYHFLEKFYMSQIAIKNKNAGA